MILQTLELQNFCQHSQLKVEFSPCLNMVVGPNGSGKTNFLRALQLAMTGDAGGEQTKADNIRQTAPHSANAGVKLTLMHDSVPYMVTRMLRPNKTTLAVGTAKPVAGAVAVNERLWSELGITKKQLDDYVFVKQQQVDALIRKSATERAQELAVLFGVNKAQKLWKELGDAANRIQVPELSDNLEAIEAKAAAAVQRQSTLEAELSTYAYVPERPETYYAARTAIIERWKAWQEKTAARATLQAAIQAEEPAIVEATRQCDYIETEEREPLRVAIACVEPRAQQAQQTLTAWAVYAANQTTVAAWEKRRAAVLARYHNRRHVPLPDDPVVVAAIKDATALATLQDSVNNAQAEHAVLREAVLMLASAAADEHCPTCGQLLPDIEARRSRLAAKQTALDAANKEWRQKAAQAAAVTNYQTDKAAEQQTRADIRREVSDLRDCRHTIMQAAEEPREAKEAAEAVIRELQAYKQAIGDVDAKLATQRAALSASQSRQAALREQLQIADAALAGLAGATEAAAIEAQSEMNMMQVAVREKHELEIRLATATAEADAARRCVAEARAIVERAATASQTQTHLEQVRQIFHANEAPRVLSYTYLQLMEQQINDTLQRFDGPFRIAADDSLGFTATFLDGQRIVPDKWLSVGERVTLALAFRIAVNSTFASSLGVLLLDEPAAGLDEHNLGCLPLALERLREVSQERGLQVVFVTHRAAELGNYFDTVIDLTA